MTMQLLLRDSLQRPDLFFWNGEIEWPRLREWLRDSRIEGRIPDDLIDLWAATGGGDFFESETILGPFGDPRMGDDVLEKREFLRSGGLAHYYLPFATGAFSAAVDTRTGEVVSFDSAWAKALSRHRSVDDWYRASARRELGPRYGIL